ncbi:MAG: DUF4136 domain-containing protein [Verrucomicrobia bacterium]|nr:DUF4136 domain-containing protein [Verrucomicrobiota bacterium]
MRLRVHAVRRSAWVAALLVGACLSGCRTTEDAQAIQPVEGAKNPSIHVLFDTTRPLPVAGTYGWGISLLRIDPRLNFTLSEIEARLHAALSAALPAEGFAFTNDAPDYLVGFAVLVGAPLAEAELNHAYGDLLHFPARHHTAPAQAYEAGVLIVDLVARDDGRLLWRGAIKADLDVDLPEDKKQARCDGAVRELLRHYPPQKQHMAAPLPQNVTH